MWSRTTVVYGVGGTLLVACLAAANMPQESDPLPPRSSRPVRSTPDILAVEVSAQAARLRTLMAQAPAPGVNTRNPFSFGSSRAARSAPVPIAAAAPAMPDAPPIVSPPALTLMGVAEETTAAGPHRTAIISGDGDTLYMVSEGEAVGDRYRVTKIGADAVELEDTVTKAYRRLALR